MTAVNFRSCQDYPGICRIGSRAALKQASAALSRMDVRIAHVEIACCDHR
jgi:hypothetical protein